MSLLERYTDFYSVHWWLSVVDVLLVLFLVLQLYNFVKGTAAIRIFIGALVIYSIWQLTDYLEMDLLHEILGQFIGVGIIALIVVFQQEIRKFLLLIASPRMYNRFLLTKWLFKLKKKPEINDQKCKTAILNACEHMARQKTGALIVMTKENDLDMYKSLGTMINADLSSYLLESIFIKDGPLHDGAVLISEDKIIAARCVLPLSDRQNLPARFGMRHRAAVGITEQTNAIAIVVSEENGKISICRGGKLTNNLSIKRLGDLISFEQE
ncbi:MAG: diadenylate cyclase CdaA [Vicingaceae bacterium]